MRTRAPYRVIWARVPHVWAETAEVKWLNYDAQRAPRGVLSMGSAGSGSIGAYDYTTMSLGDYGGERVFVTTAPRNVTR